MPVVFINKKCSKCFIGRGVVEIIVLLCCEVLHTC